jgi:hypothetical protein
MITKFDDYSGVISINVNGRKLYFHLKFDEDKMPFEVKLEMHTGNYDDLSVIIPDSDELGHKEFFINPKLDQNIVKALESENFIQESGKESIAGENKTKSYTLLI